MKYDIKGMDGLLAELAKLPDAVQKKHVWGAALAGAAIIRKKAVANAKAIDKPARDGQVDSKIYPAIKYHRAKRADPGAGKYRVGVEGGAAGNTRVPPTYWRHVEFGTEDTPARPFLRPALENSVAEVSQRVADSLWARIKKEVKPVS